MKIGILGGGQLGRMLALAGYRFGWRFRFLDPAPDAPVAPLAELIVGNFDDTKAMARFAAGIDLATFEFESVPAEAVRWLAERVPVFPGVKALKTAQDRLAEKTLFRQLDIPTPKFSSIHSEADLYEAIAKIGLPAVLKTRRFGYDGKGQRVLRSQHDGVAAWRDMGHAPLILEEFIPFQREVSLIAVRGRDGQVASYPLVENRHRDGILQMTLAPAPRASQTLQKQAEAFAARILQAVDYVGVLAVEFFERNGQLVANEIAPRVHNSGHWSIEGAVTSQFENHLRAIAGLPLGATDAVGHSAMVNLLGALPSMAQIASVRAAHVHLYDKPPAPGRKLGHVTICHSEAMPDLTELQSLVTVHRTEEIP